MPYTVYATPFGQGWIEYRDRQILGIGLPSTPSPADVPDPHPPAPVAQLATSLEGYFSGRSDLPSAAPFIPAASTSTLSDKIYRRVAAIPPGHTLTYAAVAADVGAPGAARAVGAAMARNPFAPIIPCHRVVGSDGSLRGYAGGLDMKRQLLEMEASRG